MTSKKPKLYSRKRILWTVFLSAAGGCALALFLMHFLVAANAYDPTSVYEVEANDETVSCLSIRSIQQVCNVSREIVDMQASISYNEGYADASRRGCSDDV